MPLRFGSVVNETVSINIPVREGRCDGTSYMFAEMYTLSQILYDVVDWQQYTEKA